MKRIVVLVLVITLLWPIGAFAGRLQSKRWYQERWCARMAGAMAEPASSVYDCRTDTYVIEFDYADQWYEAIGESLHYAMQTGKKAGIVLIMEHADDRRYWEKLNRTINHYRLPIHTWQTSRGVAPPQ